MEQLTEASLERILRDLMDNVSLANGPLSVMPTRLHINPTFKSMTLTMLRRSKRLPMVRGMRARRRAVAWKNYTRY